MYCHLQVFANIVAFHPDPVQRLLRGPCILTAPVLVRGIERDVGGDGLALSVYIRILSFSPSISSQIDFYLHHCDYTIKATIG